MPNDAELLRLYARAGRQMAKGLLTPAEFGNKVLLPLADDTAADVAIAPELLGALPEAARQPLRDALARVLRPEFRCPTWPIVGRPWDTEAVLTARLKAWAGALVEHLDDNPQAGEAG